MFLWEERQKEITVFTLKSKCVECMILYEIHLIVLSLCQWWSLSLKILFKLTFVDKINN